ncbi:MAG: penicillin-binding protein 2 [bacterium]
MILFILFLFLFGLIVLRLLDLQLLRHSFFQQKSMEQRTRLIELAAQRGDIFDRHGNVLATSIDTYSVYRYKKGWLARKLSLTEAEKTAAEYPKETSVLKEKKRIYPKHDLAAQAIGFVGLDNQGLASIELSLDEYLHGKEGRLITEGDPRGVELYGALRELEQGEDGMNVTLTIDENIQYVAERELKAQMLKYRAESGTCIVMDVETGEILALASKPDFDPNSYQQSASKLWHPRVVDPYEPGSTFKIFTVAAALEEGVISTETMLQARDSITVGGKVIENAHDIDWSGKSISISKMLEESINTGSVQVGLKLGPEKFYRKIIDFGFGEKTNFGLWGESNGIVGHWQRWNKPDIAMITFGQSIAVTPLQLISAVSAFANEGRQIQPLLIKKIESPDGKFVKVFSQNKVRRPISTKVANEVKQLMSNVVVFGTGKPAKIEGFGVAAKTGTAQKTTAGGRGYYKDRFIASFIGFAPLNNPRLACLVIFDDPKGTYWGATVAGPVFQKIMDYSLRYLNVKPDML